MVGKIQIDYEQWQFKMYEPQVNDYVRWTTALGMVHEGWVYYKGTPDDNVRRIKDKWVATSNYITIEIATKPRPQCDLSSFFHKRIHVCLCCYEQSWHEVKLIKKRKSKHDDTIIWTSEKGDV